jgi:sugar/nucleoside kinase (ribokinase family)
VRRLGVVGLVSLDRVDGGLRRLGGAPVYAAQALRALGHPAVLVTKLAAEDAGRGLHALGLPVVVRHSSRTIAFRIENEPGGSRSLDLEESGEPWTPEDAQGWVREALTGVDWVHCGALTRADFSSETLAVLRRGRRLSLDGQGLVRSAEPGPVSLGSDFDPSLLRHVDLLKLSQEEADALGVTADADSLRSLGVAEIVVTLGSSGCVVYWGGKAEWVRARPLDVADPTGAGDAFMAAYLSFRRGHNAPAASAHLASELVHRLLADRNAPHRRPGILSRA